MAHLISPNYGEQFLFPPALEDWVPPDHPARFLREFVEQLDLPTLGFVTPAAVEGRPPYAPSLLLKIWLYGYFNRIRSTRKLEAACGEHLSLVWLTGLISPDHNSLWRFWRDNKKALRAVFKQTVQVAVSAGCVGMALQALDGTKIEAAASGYSGWSKEYMENLLATLDEALDQAELMIVKENGDLDKTSYRLPAGLAERKALRDQIKQGLAQLAADERKHYHPVEPEARRMKVGGANRYAYNAQAVADEKEGIIVACENTRQENDRGQLVPMIEQARENLGAAAQNTTTLGDSGYAAGADLQCAEEKGMAVLAPPADPGEDKPYATQRFHFDAASKTVTCPRGVQLHYQGDTIKYGMRVERYRCRCQDCPVRSECTKDAKGRQIEVWPHTPVVQNMRKRLEEPATQRKWSQRGQIIELRFAHIKQHDGFRRWTVRGLEGVKTQWSLLCATLNLRILYRQWRNGQKPSGKTVVAALKAAVRMKTPRFLLHSLSALASSLKLNVPAGFSSSSTRTHNTSAAKTF
jgi:transposase